MKVLLILEKVPFIETKTGTIVTDSTDIASWLEKQYPERSLYPSKKFFRKTLFG